MTSVGVRTCLLQVLLYSLVLLLWLICFQLNSLAVDKGGGEVGGVEEEVNLEREDEDQD